jgi:hypothetical protein
MRTHDPENINPSGKKSLEDLVAMSAHDPDNLNPCEKKEKV